MAEPEVEAAWRAEFERSGVTQTRDALSVGGFTDEKRQAAFRSAANLPPYQVDILDCRRRCDRQSHCAGFVTIALRCRQSGPESRRADMTRTECDVRF